MSTRSIVFGTVSSVLAGLAVCYVADGTSEQGDDPDDPEAEPRPDEVEDDEALSAAEIAAAAGRPVGAWFFDVPSTGDIVVEDVCTGDEIVVTGWFSGAATFDPESGKPSVLTATGVDGFVARLEHTGALVDVVQYGGRGDQRALRCDAVGAITVLGSFSSGLTVGTGRGAEHIVASSRADLFMHTRFGDEQSSDLVHLVAGDTGRADMTCRGGSCVVAAEFTGTVRVFPATSAQEQLESRGGTDVLVIPAADGCETEGTKGACGVGALGGPGEERLGGVMAWQDNAGYGCGGWWCMVDGVFLAGAYSNGAAFSQRGAEDDALPPATRLDAFVLDLGTYGGALGRVWTATGPGDDVASAVVADPTNVYVAGSLGAGVKAGSLAFGHAEQPVLASVGGADLFVARLRHGTSGPIEAIRAGTTADDRASSITMTTGLAARAVGVAVAGSFAADDDAVPFTIAGVRGVPDCGGDRGAFIVTIDPQEPSLGPAGLLGGCDLEVRALSQDATGFVAVGEFGPALDLPGWPGDLAEPLDARVHHGFVLRWPLAPR